MNKILKMNYTFYFQEKLLSAVLRGHGFQEKHHARPFVTFCAEK